MILCVENINKPNEEAEPIEAAASPENSVQPVEKRLNNNNYEFVPNILVNHVRDRILNPIDLVVWMAFANHAQNKSCGWAGNTTVAEEIGRDRRTVIRSINRLQKAGVISRNGKTRYGTKYTSLLIRVCKAGVKQLPKPDNKTINTFPLSSKSGGIKDQKPDSSPEYLSGVNVFTPEDEIRQFNDSTDSGHVDIFADVPPIIENVPLPQSDEYADSLRTEESVPLIIWCEFDECDIVRPENEDVPFTETDEYADAQTECEEYYSNGCDESDRCM
jgi:hypothetical protein